jgi:hypothetical protein
LSNWSIKAGVANLKHDIAVIFTKKITVKSHLKGQRLFGEEELLWLSGKETEN